MKIDLEISDLKYLYERELRTEALEDKHMFLYSRAILNRMDNMIKARNMLALSMRSAKNTKQTYYLELQYRKEAVEAAQRDLAEVNTQYEEAVQAMVVSQSENNKAQMLMYQREIPRQQRRIRDKERAVQNWLERGEEKCQKISNNKLPKLYNAIKDAESLYGQMPKDELRDSALSRYNTSAPRTEQDVIAKAAMEYAANPDSFTEAKDIDYYAASKGMIMDAPKRESRANEVVVSEPNNEIVFKEIKDDGAGVSFRAWRESQPENLGTPSKESEDTSDV